MKKLLLSACLCSAMILSANAQFVKNDFLSGYTVGENLEKYAYTLADSAIATANPKLDQWNLTVKTTDQSDASPVTVAALTHADYIDSGKDVAINLNRVAATRVSGYSMTSENIYNTNTYYTAFLVKPVNVTSSNTGNGQDFFTLDGNVFVNNQRARIFLRRGATHSTSNPTFTLGLSESGSTFIWDTNEYATGTTTVLVVLKYDFTGGTVAMYINPDVTKTDAENSAAASYTISNGFAGIRSLVVKQRTANQIEVGGIRFSDSWAGVLGQDGPNSIISDNSDKGNIISTKYYNLNGIEVNEPTNTNNVYIQKNVYENGSVEVTKVIK